jgi:hypothetical protein
MTDICFHHENNKRLRRIKKGFPFGGCVIDWTIECSGHPSSVMYPQKCKWYVSKKSIEKISGELNDNTSML